MERILILEDNQKLSKYYFDLLVKENLQVLTTRNSEEFFRTFSSFKPDLLILDIKLNNSKLSGLEVFEKLVTAENLHQKVIILSGEASRSEVAKAMKLGAYTFIEKNNDFNSTKFINDIKQALNLKLQEERANSLHRDKEILRLELMGNTPLIGQSEQMMKVKERISRFAQNKIDVLIEGETGTGKDIVAKQLYLQSKRVGKPYVVVNSGGIPETLIDSELFGHKKGSFTGAYSDKKGYFEQANEGILFLDEISNLNMNIQAKILRAIEQKEVRIIGGNNTIVDVRIIFASNKKLRELTNEHKFRDDLFYRLEGNIISLPPLRDRENDIVILLEYFSKKYSEKHTCGFDLNCKKLINELTSYHWPGNVRELQKFVEYIFVLYDNVNNDIIIRELDKKKIGCKFSYDTSMRDVLKINNFFDAVNEFKKHYLKYQLNLNKKKVSLTAEAIGLERTTLYKKIKKYHL